MHKKYFFVATIWTLIVLYLCLREMSGLPNVTVPYKDKVLHALFYYGFVVFWYKSLVYFQKNLISLLIIAIALGVLIEFGQKYLTSTRSFDVFDLVANTFGAGIAFFTLRKKNAH